MTSRSFYLGAALLLCSVLASCASIQPPPGGPEDKTPPSLLESSPKERDTSVSRVTILRFQFADALDKGSFQSAFSITPYVLGKIKYKWSGLDEVEVRLSDSLRRNTTYTASISRDLKSRHGSALKAPIHLTFSTGLEIDTGKLDGFLLPAIGSTDPLKSSDIYLFAYDLAAHGADTLNFMHTYPDLMTQSDDKGAFEFLAMKPRTRYRIFAIQDILRTHLYDPGIDNYGLPIGDAVMDSTVRTDFRVRMAPQVDTIKPQLEDVDVIDAHHIRAKFSKTIDTASVAASHFNLKKTSDHKTLPIVAAWRERPDKHANEVTLLTDSLLLQNVEYELTAMRDSIHDLLHHSLSDSGVSAKFVPNAVQDTFMAPRYAGLSNMSDSVRGIGVMAKILLTLTDGVRRFPLDSVIRLLDSGKRKVAINPQWIDEEHILITPQDSLKPMEFYTFRIYTASFRSPVESAAKQPKDTVYTIRFQTEDFRDDGRLAGNIQVIDSMWARFKNGAVVVQLLDGQGVVQHEDRLAAHATVYEFNRVAKGSYRIRAFLTEFGSAAYDPGSLIPLRFASPSGDYPTEIDVRARWSTEKVDFPLK